MVEKRIRKTIDKLDYSSKHIHTPSMALRYGYDYTFLSNLLDDMDIHDIKLRDDLMNMLDDELLANVSLYIDELNTLATNVIKMYKDINFYCYLRYGNMHLSNKDKSDILKEFLLTKMSWLYPLYKDLYNDGCIFFSREDNNYGSAYLMPLIDEYYITLNRYSPSDLKDIETTIHELMHVYIAKLAYSYSWQNHHNILSGFSKESASLYSMLSFFEFCFNNHICKEDALFNRNMEDYDILSFFKTIHYFHEMGVKRGEGLTISNGISYNFDEAYPLDEDKGIPFFQYHTDQYYQESFNTFIYGTGSIEAYELLRLEKEGYDIKSILNDFTLTYQKSDISNDLFHPDLSFMANEIKKHTQELQKKYPLPGYSLLK